MMSNIDQYNLIKCQDFEMSLVVYDIGINNESYTHFHDRLFDEISTINSEKKICMTFDLFVDQSHQSN